MNGEQKKLPTLNRFRYVTFTWGISYNPTSERFPLPKSRLDEDTETCVPLLHVLSLGDEISAQKSGAYINNFCFLISYLTQLRQVDPFQCNDE